MASRQRRSKVLLYFTRKDDHRATCNACKMSISSKGGNTTIMQKHLSIQHSITLQECRVFERNGVAITLMNLRVYCVSAICFIVYTSFHYLFMSVLFLVEGEYTLKNKTALELACSMQM